MQDNTAPQYIDVTSKVPAAAGNWMTLQAASTATGLSLATLRRYIKKRIVKGRRLGKTSNAKVEVFVTPEFLNAGEAGRIAVEGLEEVLDASIEDTLEEVDIADQAAQATDETFEWMRQTIDDKESKIEHLSQQIAELNNKLAAASCWSAPERRPLRGSGTWP